MVEVRVRSLRLEACLSFDHVRIRVLVEVGLHFVYFAGNVECRRAHIILFSRIEGCLVGHEKVLMVFEAELVQVRFHGVYVAVCLLVVC